MNKLQQTLVALFAIGGSLAMSPGVGAAATCQNGFTGPDSNNLCTSTTTYQCTQTNGNTVTIANDGTQVAVSGNASTGGNGSGGGAQSGSATNTNGVTYNVAVTNQGVCTATATVPASVPVTPVAPTKKNTPVKEKVATPKVAAPKIDTPPVLAHTSGNSMHEYVAGAIALLVVTAGVARVATLLYSYRKS